MKNKKVENKKKQKKQVEKKNSKIKEEVTEKKEVENKKSNSKKKRLFILIPVITILVIVLLVVIMYFNVNNRPNQIKLVNNKFHSMDITWEYSKDSNYEVIVSSKKFNQKKIIKKLKKDNSLGSSYQIIDTKKKKKANINDILSDNDYFVAVIAYKKIGKKKYYSNLSKILKVHTKKLTISPIEDLLSPEVTDKSIKLKWTKYQLEEKNLDGTDIKITYDIYSEDTKDNKLAKVVSSISEDEYLIKDLSAITTYNYKIVVNAKVDNKQVKSKLSKNLEVTTKGSTVTNLVAKAKDTSSINISWDKYSKINDTDIPKDTLTYSIYGSDTKDGEYKLLADNLKTESYTENNLSDNKTRYYYVIALFSINNKKYDSVKSNIISATTDKKNYVPSYTPSYSYSGNSSSSSSTNSKEAQARAVARQIANSITGSNDLEKVTKAAQKVAEYANRGVYKQTGDDYSTAYGVFIKGEYSCAGTTRALGMILEEMGYSWTHKNENQWTHQWVIVNMDGQIGWADGQIGMAGYGKHPIE